VVRQVASESQWKLWRDAPGAGHGCCGGGCGGGGGAGGAMDHDCVLRVAYLENLEKADSFC